MLGHNDYDDIKRVLRWPVRDALDCYMAQAREAAAESYRHECLLFVLMKGLHFKDVKKPALPAILEE